MASAPKIIASELQEARNEEPRGLALVSKPAAVPTAQVLGAGVLAAEMTTSSRAFCLPWSGAWVGNLPAPIYGAALLKNATVKVGPSVNIDDDFHGWLLDQATVLRNRNAFALDWDHLAEELEAMAAADRRELLARLTTLFEHLLKLAYQPEEVPKRGRGWKATLVRTRNEIRRILADSPGLKGRLVEFAEETYADALDIVHQFVAELPDKSPWPVEQALNRDFFPNKDLIS